MAQLDKTFPTNDCSMCILAPKLVEAGRHPNIELITNGEIEEVEGEPGDFEVTIKKRAKSVDESICTGCGTCSENCPVRYSPQISEPEIVFVEDERVDEIIARYREEDGSLIQALLELNEEYRYLPENELRYLANGLGVPLSQAYSIGSFYNAFTFAPRGIHTIKVCTGTACHVRGGLRILEEVERKLEIGPDETTEDGLFTLETVNCLGCCALGPVMVVDNDYHGKLTAAKIGKVLKGYN
jgi:NADH-quinone oxidoreductase subunit E